MKKALASASLLLGVVAAAPAAQAQCPPGSWLCADISISGGIVAAPPPPVVYVQPPPPPPPPQVVYIQQPPPPPRVVYVQPPPMVVYQPAPPPPVYVTTTPTRFYVQQPGQSGALVGLQAHFGGLAFGSSSGSTSFMGLGGLALRARGRNGYWGGELGVSFARGTDYNRDARTEIPITATGLVYFNPQNRFQVYGLLGASLSYAYVQYAPGNAGAHRGLSEAEYGYLGGHVGLGFEYQVSQRFSLFADVRGFLRTRIDDQTSNPEFSRNLSDGSTQTTNTSMGLSSQLGAVLYF